MYKNVWKKSIKGVIKHARIVYGWMDEWMDGRTAPCRNTSVLVCFLNMRINNTCNDVRSSCGFKPLEITMMVFSPTLSTRVLLL